MKQQIKLVSVRTFTRNVYQAAPVLIAPKPRGRFSFFGALVWAFILYCWLK